MVLDFFSFYFEYNIIGCPRLESDVLRVVYCIDLFLNFFVTYDGLDCGIATVDNKLFDSFVGDFEL